jgi:hypothetical protein
MRRTGLAKLLATAAVTQRHPRYGKGSGTGTASSTGDQLPVARRRSRRFARRPQVHLAQSGRRFASNHRRRPLRPPGTASWSKLRLRSPGWRRLRRSRGSAPIGHYRITKRSWFERLQGWTTVVTAVAALVLSITTYRQLNHRPDIQMVMPKLIRIAQSDTYTWLYIQPSFTVQEKTDLTGVVSSVRVALRGPPGTNRPRFYWWGVAAFSQNNGQGLSYGYLADPAPLVVTQDKPQAQYLRFNSLVPVFTIGRWNGSLIVDRQGQSPLSTSFCIDMSASALQQIQQAQGNTWYLFRNDPPDASASLTGSGCYSLAAQQF